MNASAIRAMGLLAIFAVISLMGLAIAQSVQPAPPPKYEYVDANGVDLVTGQFVLKMTEGVIGSGDGAVSIERGQANDFGRTDQWSGAIYQRTVNGTALMYAQFDTASETFSISGSTYTATKANGATLVDTGFGTYVFTASDGSQITYQKGIDDGFNLFPFVGPGCALADAGTCALPVSMTRGNGTSFTLNWDFHTKCVGGYDSELNCLQPAGYFRFDGVASSTGYGFSFTYATDTPGNGSAPQSNWYKRTGATFTNLVTTPSPLPSVSYSYPSAGVEELTDMAGRVWRFTTTNYRLTGIRRPGASSDNITIAYHTGATVSSVTRDGVTTTYSRSVSGTTATMTVTNALSQVTTVVSDLNVGRPTSVADPLNRTTSYTYDSNGRLTRVTRPEGNYTNAAYDSRGNVTEVRKVAKLGSGLADIVVSSTFPASCTHPQSCNKPLTTTDARGNVTNYAYDSTHGGILSIILPAPVMNGIRPETRFSYTLTNGEYRVTGVSQCQTGAGGSPASCAGLADEAKTTIAYDLQGNVTSISRGNGSGTSTATETATYDPVGNLLTIDGPLSGTADTTRFRYNAGRERIGTVSPDPDGAGPLKHRATKATINSEGFLTKIERGTVNSQSDTDWASFAVLEAIEAAYDSNGRATTRKLVSGGSTYGLAQFSYDALGRPECSAKRMNPAEFGSLPASACSLDTQGIYGPDRVSKTFYDVSGQVTQTRVAFGTSDEANEMTAAYSNNGLTTMVTDAEGNKTTYEYDGHDRNIKILYPSPAKGAGTSSTADYEQFTYDASGNITNRRLRDAQSIAMSYDNLSRLTFKNFPGAAEKDITYSYDALSRLTSETQDGNALSFTYDALNRQLTQTGPHGTVTSIYDLAGRRIQIDHPDTFRLDHDVLVTGEVIKIRENQAVSGPGVLATFAYDDLGRRTSLTRGDGSVATYGFDAVSRMSQLTDNLSGTTYDQTLGFGYNPAHQVTSTTKSNDLYAWDEHFNVNRNYTSNGLNQYTAAGSITPTYDTRGNVTSAGPVTFGYNSENRLTSASGGKTLSYDPAGRLYQTVGTTTTRLAYDGANLIAEYDGTDVLQRRYVHGPGTDEPLIWYEGSGTTDRRFLHADERGSIVAVTNSSGTVLGVNSYDEHGIPSPTNLGRFQYTGQTWLPDLSMYYYKARIYSATLGRFMQTDPSGYGDGLNLYAYVRGDPVNFGDPTGLKCDIYAHNLWDIFNGNTGEYLETIVGPIHTLTFSGCEGEGYTGGNTGTGGGGGSTPKPKVCDGVTMDGTNIHISVPVQFYHGDYPDRNPSDNKQLNATDAAKYLAQMNGWWTDTIGKYSVTTNLTHGDGGLIAFVGEHVKAGGAAQLGGTIMWLKYPIPPEGTPDAFLAGRVVGHEFGHIMGNEHAVDNGQRNIMNPNSRGEPLPEHIETLLKLCGLM